MRHKDISIRAYRPEDHEIADRMVKESFPFFQRFSLVFEEGVFILENPERVLGMIKGKVFQTRGGRTIGVIAWLMIEPGSQSQAFAGPLMDKLLEFFEEQKCDEVLACAHHINTASSAGMSYFGFRPISLKEQIHSYGSELFKVWRKAFHVFDYGHLLWRKEIKASEQVLKSDHVFLHWCLNAVILLGLCIRSGELVLLPGLAYLVIRYFSLKHLLKIFGLKELRYQGWESGFLFSALISWVTGFWLPCPGLTVIDHDRWRMVKFQKRMFKSAMIFLSVFLPLIYGLSFLQEDMSVFLLKVIWMELTFSFFPFQALLGGWIYRKNKLLWLSIWGLMTAILGSLLFF